MITRNQAAEIISSEGYPISVRTLRYWETSGEIPHAKRIGRTCYYDPAILNRLRVLAATRPANIRKIRNNARLSSSVINQEWRDGTLILRVHFKKE